MKAGIKGLLEHKVPGFYYGLTSLRFFLQCRKRFRAFQSRFRREVFGGEPIRILGGPFQGLRYFDRTVWGPITPKWIGSYEEELHPVVRDILGEEYAVILDVGAAEGYYAVGSAWKSPRSRVLAYDIDPIARRRQRQLATLNKIPNLEIKKACTHGILEDEIRSAPGRVLLICDIEGAEQDLLDPEKAPALRKADLLVECHPSGADTMEAVLTSLTKAFSPSHRITEIPSAARSPDAYTSAIPELATVPPEVLAEALKEYRPGPQKWLWMEVQGIHYSAP